MRHGKQDYTSVMAAFTEKVSQESSGAANLTNENLEVLQKFVNFLETDKGHHGKGHRFMFGHGFGKHNHHHGMHGHHHGMHGPHHGMHGHHGKHHFGKHHHGKHGKHGKFGDHKHGGKHFAHWSKMSTNCEDATHCNNTQDVPAINHEFIGQMLAHLSRRNMRHCGHWCRRNEEAVSEAAVPAVSQPTQEPERNDAQDLAEEVRTITIQDAMTQ